MGCNGGLVGKTKAGNATVESGPTYDGMPVPAGGPVMYPQSGIAAGSGNVQHEENKAAIKTDSSSAPDSLEKLLDEKILPQKKTDKPVTGLLYFPMEKQKLKDLELLYGPKETRISLRFK